MKLLIKSFYQRKTTKIYLYILILIIMIMNLINVMDLNLQKISENNYANTTIGYVNQNVYPYEELVKSNYFANIKEAVFTDSIINEDKDNAFTTLGTLNKLVIMKNDSLKNNEIILVYMDDYYENNKDNLKNNKVVHIDNKEYIIKHIKSDSNISYVELSNDEYQKYVTDEKVYFFNFKKDVSVIKKDFIKVHDFTNEDSNKIKYTGMLKRYLNVIKIFNILFMIFSLVFYIITITNLLYDLRKNYKMEYYLGFSKKKIKYFTFLKLLHLLLSSFVIGLVLSIILLFIFSLFKSITVFFGYNIFLVFILYLIIMIIFVIYERIKI